MSKRAAMRRLYRLWLKEEQSIPFNEFVDVLHHLKQEIEKNAKSQTA